LLGIIDDDCVDIRHINSIFNDACGNQYIIFIVGKTEDDFLQFGRFHLTMADSDASIRHFAMDKRLYFINILNAVIDKEYLSIATHLKINGFADDIRIKALDFCLHRIAVRRRSCYIAQVACTHERKLQSARDRSCCHCKRVDISLHLSEFLLDCHTELLFLIDDQQSKVFELHILADNAMRTYENIYFTLS